MNKKFTFMVAALLAAGFSVNAQTSVTPADRIVSFDEIQENRVYYIGELSADNDLAQASDLLMGATVTNDGKIQYKTEAPASDDNFPAGIYTNSATVDTHKDYGWTIENKDKAKNLVLLKHTSGAYLTFSSTGADLTNTVSTLNADKSKATAFLMSNVSGQSTQIQFKAQGIAGDKNYLSISTANTISLVKEAPSYINIYESLEKQATIEDLNNDLGSDFSLNFAESLIGDSIFNGELNVVKITSSSDNYESSLASTDPAFYLMVEGEMPEGGSFALSTNNDKFNKAKFIVLSSEKRLSGEFESPLNGYKYEVMTGEALNKAVKDQKINAANAQFKASTTLNHNGYILYQVGAKVGSNSNATVWVDNVKEGVTSYVASRAVNVHATPIAVEAGKGTAVSVKDMVKGKMIVNVLVEKDATQRNFVSALGIDDATSSTVDLAVIENAQNAALTYPAGQWLISAGEGNNVTFINMQYPSLTESVRLYSTENANEYTVKGSGKLNGKTIKLSLVTPSVYNGYLNIDEKVTEGKTFVLSTTMNVLGSTNVPVYLVANGSNVTVTTNSDDATEWSFKKMIEGVTDTHLTTDTIYIKSDYKYWDVDTLKTKKDEVLGVAFGYKLTANGVAATNSELAAWTLGNAGSAKSVIFKEVAKDKYVLVGSSNADAAAADLNDEEKYAAINSSNNLAALANNSDFSAATQFSLITVDPAPSLAPDSKHVTFAINGLNYIAMDANNNGVVANETSTLKAATVEDFTFWIDSVDAEAVTPSFFISKGGKMMVNGKFVEDQIKAKEENFEISSEDALEQKKATVYGNYNATTSTNNKYRLKFTEATRAEGDTLMINDKKVVSDAFKFNIVEGENGGYVLKNGSKYVGAVNDQLVMADKADAVVVEVAGAEAPTSNEGVSATEVKVVAQDGSVVVKNAAGKNVVVSTILGQVVANEVLTSDNATINVPAGIVVVAVEGESFKVNVK